MHGTADPVVSLASSQDIPLTFDLLPPDGLGRYVLPLIVAPALMALVVPFWLVAERLASEPSARAILAGRPLLAVELVAGLLLLLGVFGWPLVSLAKKAVVQRRYRIDGGSVSAEERGFAGTRAWSEPLSAYRGLALRMRTSQSGVRHELVLVHPRRSRSVVVVSGPATIPSEVVTRAARLFSLAEIPSRDASNVPWSHGRRQPAEPQADLGAAAL